MIGWKWKPSRPSSRTALRTWWMAVSPFAGSTAPQAWMIRCGCRFHIAWTYSLVTGGVAIVVSRSSATSTASTPASVKSFRTSSSLLPTHCRFQYFASASTYGPWQAIHSGVPGIAVKIDDPHHLDRPCFASCTSAAAVSRSAFRNEANSAGVPGAGSVKRDSRNSTNFGSRKSA